VTKCLLQKENEPQKSYAKTTSDELSRCWKHFNTVLLRKLDY
ncbi:11448_t:CDS:1, partial [Dentiscutata erythropus]